MKFLLPIRKANAEPTPADPLGNIDQNLVTGGKDGQVSQGEVRAAGQRVSLVPSPHKGMSHIGPGEWVHINPTESSTGRGKRVGGEDAPTPDLHANQPGYTPPDANPSVHGGSLDSSPYANADDTGVHQKFDTGNPAEMASQGYDFHHPHQAVDLTHRYLDHLEQSGRLDEASHLEAKMHADDRLSLYPWEMTENGDGDWFNKNAQGYHGQLRLDEDDPGYQRWMASQGVQKARVRSIIRPHGMLPLPRKEYEADPVAHAESEKRKHERARARYRRKHRMRKDEDDENKELQDSYVAEEDADDADDEPLVEGKPEANAPADGATTTEQMDTKDMRTGTDRFPGGLYVAKSQMAKATRKNTREQDIRPMHVYKRRDGHGYRNVHVVPVGSPHGADARQEFPDPSWRLDANGHVSFMSRDFARHPRHPHTVLPIDSSEHSRHNLHTLRTLSAHARGTAEREGDTNGFWSRLPTPEEVPFYPGDDGSKDVESYQQIRDIAHHSEESAKRDKRHSHAAEGWRHYAKTLERAIEQNTGKNPEMHLLERDVEKVAAIRERAESLGKRGLSERARMHSFPQPGKTLKLSCDRTKLPALYRDLAEAATRKMAEDSEAIGKLFSSTELHDSREHDYAIIQRRAWLKLAKDLHSSPHGKDAHPANLGGAEDKWTESTGVGSGSPFFRLSQNTLTMNFDHLIPEKKRRTAERELAMDFEQYTTRVLKGEKGKIPSALAGKKIIDYLDAIKTVYGVDARQLNTILAEGVLSPQTIRSQTGLSNDSISDDEKESGLGQAIYLHEGPEGEERDATIVINPRVHDTSGAVGIPSKSMTMNTKYHLNLKNQIYRPTRTNRALMLLVHGLEAEIAAGRWNDIVEPRFCELHSQYLAVPNSVPLTMATHIILHPKTAPDIVESVRNLVQSKQPHIHVIVGTYYDI